MKLQINLNQLPSVAQMDAWTVQVRGLKQDFTPYQVMLSMQDRQSSRKMGPRRTAYVEAAERAGVQYEQILPRTFVAADFTRVLEHRNKLLMLKNALVELLENIDDTIMAAGIDGMTYTQVVHNGIRSQNNVSPAYDTILHELDEFNARVTQEEEDETPSPPAGS
jgi:hypothetical protein